jgi:ribosomal protein L16/L10AE
MAIKSTDRVARSNYRKKIEVVRVELYPTDDDIKARIADRMESGEGKATYIKRLIREDIEREKRGG